jgi:hypothetical protein
LHKILSLSLLHPSFSQRGIRTDRYRRNWFHWSYPYSHLLIQGGTRIFWKSSWWILSLWSSLKFISIDILKFELRKSAILIAAISPKYAKCGRTCDIFYSMCKKSGFLQVPILYTNIRYLKPENCCDIISSNRVLIHFQSRQPNYRSKNFVYMIL